MVDQRLGNIFFKTQQYGMSQNFVGIVIWKSQFKTIYFQKFRRRNIFFASPRKTSAASIPVTANPPQHFFESRPPKQPASNTRPPLGNLLLIRAKIPN